MRAVIFAVILSIGTCVGNEHIIGSQRSLCTDKPEGSFVADAASCSNFFICYSSEAVSQSCERGSYFDSTNLYCLPDTDNVCPQPAECSVDGTYSPHPNTCSQFYICYDGKLVEQSCAAGSYFDKTEMYCLPDTENVCPPSECSVDGAYSPHPNSCSQFYICYDGKLVEQSCAAGSYFDKTEMYCLPDTENVCPPSECSVDGAYSPHPNSCSQFYICYDGKLVEQSCAAGSYFDKTEMYCLPDTENVCPPSECSVDGAYSPHPNSCSQFYICYDGKLVEQSCAPGSYFNKTELYCLPDTENVCPPSECSVDGAYSPHPNSCSQFYICYDGKLVEQSCAPGSYFNKTELYCLPDTENVCPPSECSVDGAYSPHPNSCSQFYICYDGKLVEQSCAAGSYFDKTEMYCLPDTENVCPPSECSVDGAYSPHPNSCSQFYICYDGKLVEQSCAPGSYFNKTELYCLPDTENVCPPSECSVDGAYSPHPNSCSQFYICYDGKLVEQSCAPGSYFNKTELYCLPDTENVCPPSECSVDGAYSPHPNSCSQFYICYDGKLVEQSCAPGSYFNKTELYCLPDTENVCPPSECSVDGAYSPHPNSCSQFYICYDGKLVEQSCAPGSYFNKTELYCLPDTENVCPPSECSVDGAYSPHPNSCSQFYICYDGKLVEQSCAPGSYFNKTELYCLPDTENACPPSECSVDGAYSPHPTSCSQFYICYDGKLVEQSCAPGSYFNKTELYCVPDTDNNCPQPQCTVDGAISPYPGQCALFYVCYNGLLVEQTCGEGSYFDQENLYCLPDTDNICWPSNSTTTEQPCTCVGGYTDGEFVASPDSCYSYYICSDGELVEQNCGYGNYFDNSTKRCAEDITGKCWPSSIVTTTTTATPDPCTSCEGGYNDGDFIASPDSCYLFFVCERGELVELSCGYGNYFDNCTKVCERDFERNCWTIETTTTESSDC